jgi:tetratricopeptide (TPR) repeat protein
VPDKEISHYCQKCLAANPLGQDFCFRCGTRLMIVVEPASMRYDNSEAGGAAEEHLLERVSVLENRLGRLTDRLERALDLLLRHAQNSYFDRALLKSLIGLLNEDGVVESAKLDRLWQERCEQDAAAQEENSRRAAVQAKILSTYRGPERVSFEQLVNEGFLIIEARNLDGAVQVLQRAVEKNPQNGPLLSFIGEQFFRGGKMKLARQFLSRASEVSPDDNHILLLLALACGDEGETEKAKMLLETLTRRGGSSFAAHYGLGRLFVAEQKWQKAVREFKRALTSKPSPEANYALACLYYQLRRDGLATRHLLAAIEMDNRYREAFHLLGLVYKRLGNLEAASNAFAKATVAGVEGDASKAPGDRKLRAPDERSEPSLFLTGARRRKKLMTGGDVRLAKALREDALKAFISSK